MAPGTLTVPSSRSLPRHPDRSLYAHNRSGSGTVTHLAPEVLRAGSRLTAAVDSYAFGVLAYEVGVAVGWLVGWLAGWLAGWLVGVVGWLVGWLAG
jgi:hypothetical protein